MPQQPDSCRKLIESGWTIRWEPETQFVSAEHPEGGKKSLLQVYQRSLSGVEVNEIGQAVADLLTGKQS